MEAKNPYRPVCTDDYCVSQRCHDEKRSASAWEEGFKVGKQERIREMIEGMIRDIEIAFPCSILRNNPFAWEQVKKKWQAPSSRSGEYSLHPE